MSSSDDSVIDRLEELTSRLEAVERRLSLLETAGTAGAGDELLARRAASEEPSTEVADEAPAQDVIAAAEAVEAGGARESVAPYLSAGTVPLVGRTLLVLGGAFLLRAITEAGLVPPLVGSFLGLTYALVWLGLADRAAARRRMVDATFHGVSTAIIAFPLLWETTLQFDAVTPVVSAVALLVVGISGLWVGRRRSARPLAWIVGAGAVPAAIGLGFATRTLPPYLVCTVGLGLGILWASHALRTRGLALAAGLLVHAVFLFLMLIALADPQASLNTGMSTPILVSLLAALVAVYFGDAVARTLIGERHIDLLDVTQLVATFGIGIVGGVVIALAGDMPRPIVAATVLGLGAAFYAAAFTRVAPRQGRGLTFQLYATGGLVLAIVGLPLLAGGDVAAMALAALGVLASWLGARLSRSTAYVHGAVFVVASGFAAGLPSVLIDGLVGPPGSLMHWTTPPVLLAVAGAAIAAAIPPSVGRDRWKTVARVAAATVALLLSLSIASLICTLGGAWLPAHLAIVATLRTVVLAFTALTLLAVSRARFSDFRWVAYALLVVGAGKLLLEDLRVGHAATLFVSLAAYGGALIVVSRLTLKDAGARAREADARGNGALGEGHEETPRIEPS